MVPRRTWVVGALLLGAMAPAQQDHEQRPAPEARSAKQEYDALYQDYRQAGRARLQKFREEREKAQAAGEPVPSFDMAAFDAEWLPRFRAGATKYKGQDGAIPFLVWVAGNSNGSDQDAAIATLVADHVASPQFGEALQAIGNLSYRVGAQRVRNLVDQVLAKNQDSNVQAQAYLVRATVTFADGKTSIAGQSQADAESRRKAALDGAVADLEKGIAKAKDDALKGRLEGFLFELQHLQPGMSAPDIEGNDLDGKSFKLSDYKGKVVMLDFWGDW
jgi:hypothetical protein